MSTTIISIEKTSSEESGLFLYRDNEGRIFVNDIQNGGIFENTNLRSSMQILSVNGIQCDGLEDVAVKSIIDEAEGEVLIEVHEQETIYNAVIVDDSVTTTATGGDDGFNDNEPLAATAVDMNIAQVPQAERIYQNLTYRGVNNGNSDFDGSISMMNLRTPDGLPDGGEWAQIKYSGNHTFVMCVALAFLTGICSCCGLCAFLCPVDRKNVYVVNDRVCVCVCTTIEIILWSLVSCHFTHRVFLHIFIVFYNCSSRSIHKKDSCLERHHRFALSHCHREKKD